jgi:hypothetical protein
MALPAMNVKLIIFWTVVAVAAMLPFLGVQGRKHYSRHRQRRLERLGRL